MDTYQTQLRRKLGRLSGIWQQSGLPTAQGMETAADEIDRWKRRHGVKAIWRRPPLMVTATLDDGLGQGLRPIHRFAEIMGMRINHLGLLVNVEEILAACHRLQPDFVGLTVLQLDSDEALGRVGHGLPADTRLIAGGPVFKFDPDMGPRCGVGYVAAHVADFIDYLLNWESA